MCCTLLTTVPSDGRTPRKTCGERFEGKLPNFDGGVSVTLADYGGKMVVLWDQNTGRKLVKFGEK
ncbi:hypothetical protein F2Q68_00034844 [Brassica cretica]|uniref:Uncharacterized protein n=1 Tax=Brassica cretica TaxID=69181 RepID=A0A8S9H2I3_BRACR|nr:hypothetical protein F2Q68_00034844 [Brassica cretica]